MTLLLAVFVVSIQASAAPAPAATADELRALFAEAVRRQQARELPGAEQAYVRFLAQQPRNVEALSNLGAVLAAQGRHEEAIARYREALAVDAARSAVRLNLAMTLQKAGRITEAVAELQRVVAEAARTAYRGGAAGGGPRAPGRIRQGGGAAPAPVRAGARRPRGGLPARPVADPGQAGDEGQVVLDRVLRGGASAETYLLLGVVKLRRGRVHGRARRPAARRRARTRRCPWSTGCWAAR